MASAIDRILEMLVLPVTRERLVFNQELLGAAKEELARLHQALAECGEQLRESREREHEYAEQIRRAEAGAAQQRDSNALEEHHGAFFRRGSDGKLMTTVYCHGCRRSTTSYSAVHKFICTPCKWSSDFTRSGMEAFVDELNGDPPHAPPATGPQRVRRDSWVRGGRP